MSKFKNKKVLVIISIFAALTAAAAAGIELLWNWLMPELFGLPAISYLQALGLRVIASLLFGSFSVSAQKQARGYTSY